MSTQAAAQKPPPRADPHAASLGLCDGLEARELFYATVHEVIIGARVQRAPSLW